MTEFCKIFRTVLYSTIFFTHEIEIGISKQIKLKIKISELFALQILIII